MKDARSEKLYREAVGQARNSVKEGRLAILHRFWAIGDVVIATGGAPDDRAVIEEVADVLGVEVDMVWASSRFRRTFSSEQDLEELAEKGMSGTVLAQMMAYSGLSWQVWDKLRLLRSKETWPSHEFIKAFMAAHSGGPPRDERTGSAAGVQDSEET
ncbi:MAG: hypothetical protein HQ559_08540 [Lentisphaerae bacterium]|nr:hypothetical protein [Lentisphaerota bacterium]